MILTNMRLIEWVKLSGSKLGFTVDTQIHLDTQTLRYGLWSISLKCLPVKSNISSVLERHQHQTHSKLYVSDLFDVSRIPSKLLANSYIGELGRKYSRKDHGFTCGSLNTAQCIWTSALAEKRDVTIDSYQDPTSKRELYLVERDKLSVFSQIILPSIDFSFLRLY